MSYWFHFSRWAKKLGLIGVALALALSTAVFYMSQQAPKMDRVGVRFWSSRELYQVWIVLDDPAFINSFVAKNQDLLTVQKYFPTDAGEEAVAQAFRGRIFGAKLSGPRAGVLYVDVDPGIDGVDLLERVLQHVNTYAREIKVRRNTEAMKLLQSSNEESAFSADLKARAQAELLAGQFKAMARENLITTVFPKTPLRFSASPPTGFLAFFCFVLVISVFGVVVAILAWRDQDAQPHRS